MFFFWPRGWFTAILSADASIQCLQTKIFVQTSENIKKLFRKTPTRALANLVVYQLHCYNFVVFME